MNKNMSFNRMELLIGNNALQRLSCARVILFGVGGVGSWCAEGLVRSGVSRLTIVDSDRVCITNINRQVQATKNSIGKVKVFELASRLNEINPDAEITTIHKVYDRDTYDEFNLAEYDFVIDAIDSISNKVELIVRSKMAGVKIYSSLGASSRLDPTRIKIGSIWKTHGCKLGKHVRSGLRKAGMNDDLICVWSDEFIENDLNKTTCGTPDCVCPKSDTPDDDFHEWCSKKKKINGSAVHITSIYGMMLAGLVINDINTNT